MKKYLLALCVPIVGLLLPHPLSAQPANNNFASAAALSGTVVTTSVTTSGANKEDGEPNHAGNNGGRSVWYNWTAPATGQTTLGTTNSSFVTLLAVYTGAAVNALTQIAAVRGEFVFGAPIPATNLQFAAVQGTTYRIAVDARRFGGGTPGGGTCTLNLRVQASVNITSPANGAVFSAGSSIPFNVSATVPGATVSRVDFYRAGALIGSDMDAPYGMTYSNVPLGSNTLTAVAVDSTGLSWPSPSVTVAVLAQGLTITSPSDGASFLSTSPITVGVVGVLAAGSITNVEFFVDEVKFGQSASVPFTAVWGAVTPGAHRFLATGKDNSGLSYTSAPAFIAVAQTLVASNSSWKYLDNGSDQGTAWIAPGFDDSAWTNGVAELGYGQGDEATVVSFGLDPNNKYPATYFRKTFTASGVAGLTNLTLYLERDDGGVVYLNGREVYRSPNMPAGTITFTTLTTDAQGISDTLDIVTLSATNLVEGNNVLAAEIHQQSLTSSDITFNVQLVGTPIIPRNLPPSVVLTSPTNNADFLAPASITLYATASDTDGAVTNVAFRRQDIFGSDMLLGNSTTPPYQFVWNSPPEGWYGVYAIATDDMGASAAAAGSFVTVYDAIGTPRVQIFGPTTGTTFQGPTNVALFAGTTSPNGITNVIFQTNGSAIGQVAFPTSFGQVSANFTWTNATYGTTLVTAVSSDAVGLISTSAPVTVIVDPPPPNIFAPTVAAVAPAPSSTVGALTGVQITFSERVVGVNASDLIVSGVPASSVTGSGSNYTFLVTQPPYGEVTVYWTVNHGIEDVGFPPLPFDATAPGATWDYNLVDLIPPTIVTRAPAAGATITNLTQISITFSEPVSGVDAADLLINGAPAVGLNGGGSTYSFSFPLPSSTNVNVSWAATAGIADLAASPNAFNSASSTWSYTLDNRTVLVQSNSTWLFIKAFAEASSPIDAWRQIEFNDGIWSNAPAPFFYGDPYGNGLPASTLLSDMQGGSYSSIYLRKTFVVGNASAVSNLFLNAQSDDGFIAWINGVEVVRYNMGAGDIPYNSSAPTSANEPNNNGVPYILSSFPSGSLVDGTNVLTIHAFNNMPATSSDFGINAQLYTYLADPSVVAPRVASVAPAAGDVFYLTNIIVRFTEPVASIDADNLLINGVPATGLSSTNSSAYLFSFVQPAYGQVAITWAGNQSIMDFDSPPKPFDGNAIGSTFQYSLLNPSSPNVAAQSPLASASVSNLTQIVVTFSEPVSGVNATDLTINGQPAAGVSGGPAAYTFTFLQPAYGNVAVGWVGSHGISDVELPPNPFEAARAGNTWSYTLLDQIPPAIASKSPPAGAQVTNLTSISVTFTESVAGVNTSDLLINNLPATGLSGSGAGPYLFTFPQPNAVIINITWAAAHGIRDLAPAPNAFASTAAGATWTYLTPDTLAPVVAVIDPPPFVTVKSLISLRVTFSEPVTGVDTNDLLINNRKAVQVTGSGVGPYTFSFLPPTNGLVDVRWVSPNGITDLAGPPNSFAGGEWGYTLDPNASFAGKIVFNEIMFNPFGGAKSNEWVELRNLATNLINLTGWRFTRGVDFTFPNVSIPAGGYLVVAANLASFQAGHPTVTNVIGGWTGSLANSDDTLELTTALGEGVNSVHYASDGDWGQRVRGNGSELVESLTRNGSTATITIFQHTYSANDQIIISGADQPEYNGRFTVANAGQTTFNITVNGTPATPATGNILCRWVLDDANAGWSWFNAAAGFGSSLELANSALPNSSGQNWSPSVTASGTPGRANSAATNNVAPLIEEIVHFPSVPKSTDSVAITARVRDELSNGVASVTLFYRNHTAANPSAFASASMFDDGVHSDGVNGDGLFGAVLPPNANGVVIEFYVQAADTSGRVRTWPSPALETNGPGATFGTPGQFANALYQVDDESITNAMGSIRIVFSGTERALFPPSNRNSDSSPNCTLISTDGDGVKVRYLCSTRIRGAGSRSRTPPNNRIDIPSDNRWNGLAAINLNAQFVHAQLVGNNLALKSGLPAEPARIVQYRINGANPASTTAPQNGSGNGAGWGTFLLVEPANGDLAANLYPQNDGGNYYRASTGNHSADLSYQNGIPANYLGRGYYKTSNKSENDWSDFALLTFAFSQVASDADYFQAISTNVNVQEWMTYFAVGSLMNFGETSLFNGRGDDYALYRGEPDRRFVVLGHDFDTIFGWGDTTAAATYAFNTNSSIFIMLNPPNGNANVPNLNRFMRNPNFAPLFYAELQRLCDTTFQPTNLNPLFDQLLGNWNGPGPSATVIAEMKSWAANRRTIALSQIPLALTVNSALPPANGYLSTTTPGVTLFGSANAINTRKVLVNGVVATWNAYDARWTNTVALQPGINRVLVQSLNSNDVEFASSTVDIWYDDSSVAGVSGAITTDTIWTAAGGPYNVTASVTVNSGTTLTIQQGATLYLAAGVNITVANGGRLLAEGTATAPIRFSRTPGAATSWGGITVNGGAGSPETRIAYAHFEFNGSTAIHATAGTVFLDHLTFGNAAVQYLSLDASSFVVQDCVFPATTGSFEPVHGAQGIKAGGRGIVRRNFWGKVSGYNDAFDFTGGNRPGPILQVLNNVFVGSDDDMLDLDSTDAWVEGNIFLHCHRNGASPDSSSAVSGGSDNAENSQVTVIGNLMYDIDHAANAKQTNYYTFINNTVVHQTKVGGIDADAGVITMADEGTPLGLGFYLEGNIIWDAEKLVRTQGVAQVTFTNNILPLPWAGAGGGNSTNDPLFVHLPQLSETTNFTSWAQAQVLWNWFSLRTGSPARGTGPGGLDKGGVIPSGASLSGQPVGRTPLNSATLRVGPNRTGFGIPAGGFPGGSGFTHYKWRLDGGAWSAETPAATLITLNNLANGPHYVEVSGRNDAGFYQDDAVFGNDAAVTVSRTWTVDNTASSLRLNELLAVNSSTSNHFGATPDLIELWNSGTSALDLSGVGLTDDPANPAKFLFPLNTTLAAGAYLTVFADSAASAGYHLGFTLPQTGGSVYLYESGVYGGARLDSVTFGLQLTDRSVGRLADGTWALCVPTFSGLNRAAAAGDPRSLRINEWLAIALTPINTDFIELYNTGLLPVSLGGLYLSDEILGWPARHQLPALSFMAGSGYLRLLADGNAGAGADHLNFTLNGDQGSLGIFLPDLTPIDCVVYQAQLANVSQGRSPNGSSTIASFPTPTPGAPNPLIVGPPPNGGVLVLNEVLAINSTLNELDGRTPDWVELYNGTAGTVNLGDLSLTDNTLAPRKFILPATAMAPGAFLRVLCDPGTTNSGPLLNTNFAVKSSGGAIYLFDSLANGGSLLNSITYGLQMADLSIGRIPDGSTNWFLTSPTPGSANIAVPTLGNATTLRVNEWMAEPGPAKDDWFEIYNPGSLPIALGGLYLTDNLNDRTKHPITALSFIGAGTNGYIQFRADGDTAAGADHVSFSLRALGEAVGISTAAGTLIDGVTFGEQLLGVSEGRFSDGSANIVALTGTDSPAAQNYRLLTAVVINEVLTHTDEPLEDAIELFNPAGQPIDVSGWWLSDDQGTLQKYQIPFGTVIPANGFTVIYETHFTNATEAAFPFALSSDGDEVVLSAATNNLLTGYRTSLKFGAAENGASFGRYRTSDGRDEFVTMSARTFGADDPGSVLEFRTGTGATNAYPKIGPVVMSEIMYHPPDIGIIDNGIDEFIELHNITTAAVLLYDNAHPTNVWRLRDGVDFDFPTGTSIPAGGYLLVVSFDPINNPAALAAFRAKYHVDPGTAVVGPWNGRLANDHEDIELRRPDSPNLDDVPYILVEHVHYYDLAPWAAQADGTGFSLQRLADDEFGNDPANWTASAPTAGPQSGTADSDGDGLPDAWENLYNLDPFNSADAALDSDGDGLTNLQEFQIGSDPRDAESGLQLLISLAPGGGNVVLSFIAYSNLIFAVDYTDALGTPWQLFEQFAVAPTNRVVTRVIPATGTVRFFRLRLETVAPLRLNAITPLPGNQVTLTLSAPAGQGCTLLFAPNLPGSPWTSVTNFPAAPTNRVIQVVAPAPGHHGFFRLQSP